jgi:dihydroorotate dehydrogenase electron transfer subunit
LLRRPFSICRRDRRDGWIEVLWKVVGQGTRILAGRRAGEIIDVLGPLGRSFRIAPQRSRALLIGGGLGVAPLPFLCEELLAADVTVEVYLGARTATELACVDLFEEMGVRVDLSTDDGSLGRRGFVTEAVEERLQGLGDLGGVWLYGCGPEAMLARVDDMALRWQVTGQISVETMMGCGFGICMGCALPARGGEVGGGLYKLACIDGPVFEAGEVVLSG